MTTYADRRANPVGKLPDDTWVLRPQETDDHFQPDADTWYVSRVCGTFKERTGHPCQMPEAVLERIIRVATERGRPGARPVRRQRHDAGRGEEAAAGDTWAWNCRRRTPTRCGSGCWRCDRTRRSR